MYLFERDSLVVRTATELLATHQPLADGDTGDACAACGAPSPCLTAVNARQVASAANLE